MADIAYRPAQVLSITSPAPNLDPIDVIFLDASPGRGRIIVRCYSQAWTAWWGAMGEHHTVRTFFLSCDVQYLVGYLLHGQSEAMLVRKRALQEAYLGRIVRAIQEALRSEGLVSAGRPGAIGAPEGS